MTRDITPLDATLEAMRAEGPEAKLNRSLDMIAKLVAENEKLRADVATLELRNAMLKKEGGDMLEALNRAKQNAEHALGNYYLALEAIERLRAEDDDEPAPDLPKVLHA